MRDLTPFQLAFAVVSTAISVESVEICSTQLYFALVGNLEEDAVITWLACKQNANAVLFFISMQSAFNPIGGSLAGPAQNRTAVICFRYEGGLSYEIFCTHSNFSLKARNLLYTLYTTMYLTHSLYLLEVSVKRF